MMRCPELLRYCTTGVDVETRCEGVERCPRVQSCCADLGDGEVVCMSVGFEAAKDTGTARMAKSACGKRKELGCEHIQGLPAAQTHGKEWDTDTKKFCKRSGCMVA